MTGRCAVLGTGQTNHASARRDVSMKGLVREAAERALTDAELRWSDVDALVLGKSPDIMEGVMTPELFLADALAAAGKPVFRAYTSGNAGGMAASTGVNLVSAGLYSRVLVVAFEKQSEVRAAGATVQHFPFEARWQGGPGGLYAPVCRQYIDRYGIPGHIGDVAALKDRKNLLLNPYAHGRRPGITLEEIATSRMLWDPIRLLHSSPSSDGACAVVLGSESAAARSRAPAWVRGCAVRTEPPVSPDHDSVDPLCGSDCAAEVYRQAGIDDPLEEVDVAELFVPYSWMEPIVLENLGLLGPGEGWRFVDDGGTAIGGRLPVNPSGGLLGANPIGAGGLIRFAEAAMQVRGQAGDHQVDGARLALGHAAGGFSNCVAMWAVGTERP